MQDKIERWQHHWLTPSGDKTISYHKRKAGHLLRFPGLVDFWISHSADRIAGYPAPVTPHETVRHLLLDQVLPRCLTHQGMLMVHASAVYTARGALLFVGSTGKGKSTLAGYFHQSGYEAISDDCVRLLDAGDLVEVLPSYAGLRLWDDTREELFPSEAEITRMTHYSSKQRVQISSSSQEFTPGIPILAVLFLTLTNDLNLGEQDVHLSKQTRREAFIEIMKQTFLLDVTDRDRYGPLIQRLGRIVPKLNSFQLNLPRDYAALPQVRQAILEQVSTK